VIDLDGGLVLIGPASEWFWTAFSGVLVAISLLALFRQLRLQTGQKMREDVASLEAEYSSERFLRYRLQLALALRDGLPPAQMPEAACTAIVGFWETVGSFTRGKHFDKKMTAKILGAMAVGVWPHLEPWVQFQRREYSSDETFNDYEWLVRELVRTEPVLSGLLEPQPSSYYADWVTYLEELIAVEVELRR
jgi:hypothetical protein